MKVRSVVHFISVCFIAVVFCTCNEVYRNRSHADVPLSSIEKGKELAARYCQSCHLLPDPSWLDAGSWEQGVLPNMGPRLGIFAYGFQIYPSAKGNVHLPQHFYPDSPQLSFVEWQYIIDYYTATSPDTLASEKMQDAVPADLKLFKVLQPPVRYKPPMTSYTHLNTADSTVCIFDIATQQMLVYDAALNLKDSLEISGAVSDALFLNDSVAVWANMGNINPSDAPLGSVLQSVNTTSTTLFKNLQRPVSIKDADINCDGRTDYIVCSFGFLTGHLSWYESMGDGSFQQHIIQRLPGAAQVYVADENGDAKPDLWVLFAQGDESIRRYINKGGGAFEEQVVLRFPPVWGSTSFELTDMTGDGKKDIVYTCGDNADYSKVLKPYHGVYIFVQEVEGFIQRYFFPMDGAFKARTLDFDGDGDKDIAAISFFADYKRKPQEGFVFLENKGALSFRPATFPQAASGRWITLDAGDVNGDGQPDIVIGNMAKGFDALESTISWEKGPPFLLLQNNEKK